MAKVEKEPIKCFLCFGRGKIWTEDSDPIEGNKLRNSMECPLCDGLPLTHEQNEPLLAAAKIYGKTLRKKRKKIEDERRRKYVINRGIELKKQRDAIEKELLDYE